MASRRGARRTAIDILYQADITGRDPAEVLEGWSDAGREVPDFARELVEGVAAQRLRVDTELDSHSEGWSLERMAALDRTILRVGIYELLFRPDVPVAAAISEAVEAARDLSADEARAFVNGILGVIASEAGRGEPTG